MQRPLPAPEVSNTPQGFSFLRSDVRDGLLLGTLYLQDTIHVFTCYALCYVWGEGDDISGLLSRGAFLIMLHCASLQ